MHTFGRSPVEFVEGHGMKLTGDDGREYLDFLAGIGVCSLGHGNSAVLSALEVQTKKLMHVSNYFYIEQRGQVAALLSKLANDDVDGACVLADAIASGDETTAAALGAPAADEQVWETFFANSGAEANEGSMKLARLYAKRAGNGGNTIVCMRGGFHGRTLETIAATMQDWLTRTASVRCRAVLWPARPTMSTNCAQSLSSWEARSAPSCSSRFRVRAVCTP